MENVNGKLYAKLDPVQTSLLSCAELNAYQSSNNGFLLICIEFGAWKEQRLKWVLASYQLILKRFFKTAYKPPVYKPT